MKKATAVLIGLFLSVALYAQQYILRYDMATEELQYLKIKRPGDTVTASVIDMNKARRINLQLLNTAGSYRQQVILHEQEELQEPILIPGLGSRLNSRRLNSSASLCKFGALPTPVNSHAPA